MKLIVILLAAVLAVVQAGKLHYIHHEYYGPPAPLSKYGSVVDTEEVEHAKANHFAIYTETIEDLIKKMAEAKKELEEKVKEVEAVKEAVKEESKPAEEAPKVEEAKAPETKPVVEIQESNELDAGPVPIPQSIYVGPLAPLSHDGQVVDTPEVAKVKEAHLKALEEAAKLSAAEEPKAEEDKSNEVHQHKIVYLSPLHILYTHGAPIGYEGPLAPLSKDGQVLETPEVLHAKYVHIKAHEHAKEIAKRNPPRAEYDNYI